MKGVAKCACKKQYIKEMVEAHVRMEYGHIQSFYGRMSPPCASILFPHIVAVITL